MKYFLINKTTGSLFAEGDLIQANNTKEALEKLLNKKVIRDEKNPDYSVIESNAKGEYHWDRRKWVYYKLKTLNE